MGKGREDKISWGRKAKRHTGWTIYLSWNIRSNFSYRKRSIIFEWRYATLPAAIPGK
jgi:hypothetical protein